MPNAAVAFVKIIIAVFAVPPALRNTVAGEVENVTPWGTVGMIPSDIETLPENPPMLVTVILNEPAESGVRVRTLGLIVMEKSGPTVEDMVRRRVVVWERMPLVPVTWME